jgi:hypothetical protein
MTFTEALRLARPLIESGEVRSICAAIGCIVPSYEAYMEHEHKVLKLLDGSVTYEAWVHRRHPKTWRRMTASDFRDGRLQWIDYMIAREDEV